MDQRNAGASRGPVREDDGWDSFLEDQLALLDHLGIERCAALGMCIGGPYVMNLLQAQPERFFAGVLLQPIGLDGNREAFLGMVDSWAEDLLPERPDLSPETLEGLRDRMFSNDFLFAVSEEDVRHCPVPLQIMLGNDLFHPGKYQPPRRRTGAPGGAYRGLEGEGGAGGGGDGPSHLSVSERRGGAMTTVDNEKERFGMARGGETWVRAQAQLDQMLAPLLDALLAGAALQPGRRVLDLGCGCGASSLAAAESGAEVVGLDFSAPMISLAEARGKAASARALRFICEDATKAVFPTPFDHLISRFGACSSRTR